MKIILPIISIFIFQNAIAQSANEYAIKTKVFTDSVFAQAHRFNKKLIVAATLDTTTYRSMRRTLSKGIFIKRISYGKGKPSVTDTFRLSDEEKEYIDKFLLEATNFHWTNRSISNAIILPSDTVDNIYAKHGNEIDSYLSQHYGEGRIFFLSKPIFLRNETICIFENDMDCGFLCGSGELMIYIRKNEGWERYMKLSEWTE